MGQRNAIKQTRQQLDLFFKKFFGIRIIKTALATSLSYYIATKIGLKMPIMACLAAITTITSSLFATIETSIRRMISTTVGILIASFFHYIGFFGFFPIMIGTILIIHICNFFNWKKAIDLSIMIFVIVIIYVPSPPEYMSFYEYGLNRFIDTAIGLIVGFIINYFLLPPDRGEFIIRTYDMALLECEDALLNILSKKSVNLKSISNKINELHSDFDAIKKDSQFGSKYLLKIYQLSNINTKFFSAFGIISQFTEEDKLPILSKENKEKLAQYFGKTIEIDSDNYSNEFELAFNFYLEELLNLLRELKENIEQIRKIIEENKKTKHSNNKH